MTPLKLRAYQEECLNKIIEKASQGIRRQLIALPTGAGKTVVFAHLIERTKRRALVLAHTNELLEQAKEKIEMVCPGLSVGLINSDNKEFDKQVVISSIQSARRPETLKQLQQQDFTLLIADECHHFGAESPRHILDSLGFGKSTQHLLVGFTATAFRNDSKGLGEVFDSITYQRSIKEMIQDGYLCSPKGLKIATDLDLSNVKTEDGDFQASSLAQAMDLPEMNRLVVESYRNHASDRKALCFGVTVQHAANLSDTFQRQGISSKLVHGGMAKEERSAIIKDYRNGAIQVLCNCQVLTEGFDAPETACVIVARPTKSRGLYQQVVGRGLRLWPNKLDCVVLDFGDQNHSLCSTAILLQDAECEQIIEEDEEDEGKKEILATLPPKLNQKLKSVILNYDPLGESFTWERDGKSYVMKGSGKSCLTIYQQSEDRYRVFFSNGAENRLVAENLTFEYAFSSAEDFAKENRKLFVVSDRQADWRNYPISDRQKAHIRSRGFRAGIDGLTRGQAAILIGSGALRRG